MELIDLIVITAQYDGWNPLAFFWILKLWIWSYWDIFQTLIFCWLDFLEVILVVEYAEVILY